MNSIKDKIVAFHACHQGASHNGTGKVCQDYAFSRFRAKDFYAVAIVSDGHGSSDYFRSDRGSKFAVRTTQEAINRFMQVMKETDLSSFRLEELMRQLEMNILYNLGKRFARIINAIRLRNRRRRR